MPVTRSLMALTGALAALAFAPAAASATTYCVNKPACVSAGGTNQLSLGAALASANGSAGVADRIELGAGTYVTASGFAYDGAGGPVDIAGAGRGQTTLAGPATDTDAQFTVLSIFGSSSSVSDLDVQTPDGDDANDTRIGLATTGTARRIGVSERTDDNTAPQLIGIYLAFGGRAVDSSVRGRFGTSSVGVAALSGGGSADNVNTRGTDFGAYVDEAPADLRRLDVQAGSAAVFALDSPVTVTNSLLRGISGVRTFAGSKDASARLANDTIVALGAGGNGIEAQADGAGHRPAVTVDSSIVRGFDHSVAYGGSQPGTELTVRNSDFDPSTALSLGSTSTVDLATANINANPLFADPTSGDFRLAAGSPAIDRGNPQPLGLAPDPFDLAGSPRPLDGDGLNGAQPDMGAYEAPTVVLPVAVPPAGPPVTPPKDTIAPAVSSPALSAKRFRVASGKTATSAATPKGTKIRFALSEAATVSLKIERATKGRRKGKSCSTRAKKGPRCTSYTAAGTLTRKLKAGKATVPFTGRIGSKALKPGTYRLTLTARDAAGNRSKARTLAFTIVR